MQNYAINQIEPLQKAIGQCEKNWHMMSSASGVDSLIDGKLNCN